MTRPARVRSRANQARVAQVWLVLGLLLLLVFGLFGLQAWRTWELSQRQLRSDAQAGATVAAAQIGTAVQHLQDILLHTRLTYEQSGLAQLEHDPLARARSGAQPPFRFIAVLDGSGQLLLRHPAAARLPALEGLARAIAERGGTASRLQIIVLPDGPRTLLLAQRLDRHDGRFAGAALAALEPALLQTALVASLNHPLLSARITLDNAGAIDGLDGAAPSPGAQALLRAPIDADAGLQLQVLADPVEVRNAWLQQMLWPGVAAFGSAAVLVALGVALLRGLQREIASELRAQTAATEVEVRSRFLAHMSHEIRTPMNGVLGAVELLAAQGLSAEQQRLLEVVRRSGESLLTLLNDLLDASKIDAGRLTLTLSSFDLAQTLEDVVVLLAPLAQRKGLRLWHRLAPALPQQVVGDALRVRQVLTNLLGNAIKFTEHGEVALHAASIPGGGVRITVRDTGIGIDAEHLPRLFKPFAQLHAHTPHRFGGTGLGLSIAATLVEMMNGTLDVDSVPGEGSTFTVTLPLALDDMPLERLLPPRPPEGTPALLLVRDASGTAALRDHLAWAGWTVHAVDSVDGGLQRAAVLQLADGSPPAWVVDCAALDVPPDQALRQLRAHAQWQAAAPLLLLCDLQPPYPEARGAVVLRQPARRMELAQALWRAWQQEHHAAPAPAPAAVPTLAAATPVPPLRVLAAEDSAVNRMILAEMLSHLGCQATLVEDGAQALQALLHECFDLVLMDCAMPVMDGLEATRRWRAVERGDPARGRVPIVALTAFAMPGDRQRCLDNGMDDHMSKPFTIAELKAVLERHGAPAAGLPAAAPPEGRRPA
jgi:signal transduction histidine kinase/CheY-like chemotaxis protein